MTAMNTTPHLPPSNPEKTFPRVAMVMAVTTLLAFASCSRQPAGGPNRRGGGGAPVPVLVARAEAMDIPVEIRAIGTVQPFSMVALRSQITGPIESVHFEEGHDVQAGDLLFTIDPRPFESMLNQARANLKRDEAQLF